MNTLTISQIFENFLFYQENYLSILQDSEQYFIQVEQAYLDVWPFTEKKLYLGDLLQLWFSEKWLINTPCRLLNSSSQVSSSSDTQATQKPVQRTQDFYLFQLSGSTLSGSNHAQIGQFQNKKCFMFLWIASLNITAILNRLNAQKTILKTRLNCISKRFNQTIENAFKCDFKSA